MSALLVAVGLWIGIYTFSYGVWEWKEKNKHGAVFVFCISMLTFMLFLYCSVVY